jgi:hypothetical protein
MTKARKPSFEPATVPVRNGDFQAWLDLVFRTAVDAGERQMKINAERGSTAERVNAAKAAIRKSALEAARRRINGGDGAGEAA